MISLLVDHNFNERIIEGMLRQDAAISFLRVRALRLANAEDPVILEWAAVNGRVLLTHDRRTIPRFVEQRIQAGLSVAGVFLVRLDLSIGQAIEELLIAVLCLTAEECLNTVWYFPL